MLRDFSDDTPAAFYSSMCMHVYSLLSSPPSAAGIGFHIFRDSLLIALTTQDRTFQHVHQGHPTSCASDVFHPGNLNLFTVPVYERSLLCLHLPQHQLLIRRSRMSFSDDTTAPQGATRPGARSPFFSNHLQIVGCCGAQQT